MVVLQILSEPSNKTTTIGDIYWEGQLIPVDYILVSGRKCWVSFQTIEESKIKS